MLRQILVLSGPLAVGKSSLSGLLEQRFGFRVVKTRELLQQRDPTLTTRGALQVAGTKLDQETGGAWIARELQRFVGKEDQEYLIIDSVRIHGQIEAIQKSLGRLVVHVHLMADDDELRRRFESREVDFNESTYEDAKSDPTEQQVGSLAKEADVVVRTDRDSPEGCATRVAAFLGFYNAPEPLVDVLVGGQYGSEGKGQVAAYLSPEYDLLVRVGGANAGHKVWTQDGPDTFRHLPSGTNSCQAGLLLGPGAVIYTPELLRALADYRVGSDRLSIDPQAMIVEDIDRQREHKGKLVAEISSTGRGIGEATSRKVLRNNANPPVRLARDLGVLRPFIRPAGEVLEDAFAKRKRVFLEGTQGTGLSIHHGRYPYVTSRDTTVSGCLADAGIGPGHVRRIIMVCRTYPIRVGDPPGEGTSGYMWRPIEADVIAERSKVPLSEIQETEKGSVSGKPRRFGEFDWDLLRQSSRLNSPTDIAMTFADYLDVRNQDARRFDQLSQETILFIEEVERAASAHVSLISTRFHLRSIIDRRSWGQRKRT